MIIKRLLLSNYPKDWYNKFKYGTIKECVHMWTTIFGIVCLGIALLNAGYILFDNEN